MDLTLSLSYIEQNDNKAIVLTDTSNYGQFGYGSSSPTTPPLYPGNHLEVGKLYQIQTDGGHNTFSLSGCSDDIVGHRFIATNSTPLQAGDCCIEVTPYAGEITACTLDVSITNSSNTTTSYDQVDLYSIFGPFSSQDDLEYTLDKSYFGGSNGDELVDGIYSLKYNVTYKGTNQSGSTTASATELDQDVLVYGVVKNSVYDKLRQLPIAYDCKDCDVNTVIKEGDFVAAYLSAIEKAAYVSKGEELIIMLSTLESILNNSSYIIW